MPEHNERKLKPPNLPIFLGADATKGLGVTRISIVLFSAIYLAISASAQTASSSKPALSPLDRWRTSRAEVYMNDFGELSRYRAADATLNPPAPGEKRVVFFGDSITDSWPLPEYFPGKPYINRGISGQTTSQMLVRFQQDVVALHPKAVVILAGTNDIAGNTGPMRLEDIEANYTSLAELAGANGIKVVFSSVLPVHNYTPQSQDFFADRSPAKILELNHWLSAYCRAHGLAYLDYFHAMVDDKGLLKKELADDGLHPNEAGFKIMAPLAEAAIAKALGAKQD
jgi:lysophospholipase L1-like esterase